MSEASDPRLHGPPTCPVAPKGCYACSGRHHWLESSVPEEAEEDPDDPNVSATDRAVLAHDRANGTEHGLVFFGCKHCEAWAEAGYVWDLEESEDDQAEDDWDDNDGDFMPGCGGTGFVECECGGDGCVCGRETVPCGGCEDCGWDDDEEDLG